MVGLTGTVALDGNVEQSIVLFFSRASGGCSDELPEEDIIRRLSGSFAAWKVCSGLVWLHEQGVTAPVSHVRGAFVRRCWRIRAEDWARIRLTEAFELGSRR